MIERLNDDWKVERLKGQMTKGMINLLKGRKTKTSNDWKVEWLKGQLTEMLSDWKVE